MASTVQDKLTLVQELELQIKRKKKLEERLAFLKSLPQTRLFFERYPFEKILSKLSRSDRELIYTLIAINQGPQVFFGYNKIHFLKSLKLLAQSLRPLQKYYHSIGGLLGYYSQCLTLLGKEKDSFCCNLYEKPPGLKLEENPTIQEYITFSLENLSLLGEVYPVGGAADRLNLKHEVTQEPLPQACLFFFGKTLLETLIRDLEGREYLYEKLFGKKIVTPIALMTSKEKNNTSLIKEILEQNHWFGRAKDSFFLFEQPLVPMIAEDGSLAIQEPLKLILKPGGHGFLWLLMKEYGVFDWFQKKGRDYLVVRQINNPLAGLDMNLLALSGQGMKEKKSFGFLSCQRRLKASEGMNVLMVKPIQNGYKTNITNVEYTDFHAKGIEDRPEKPGSLYSTFPSNTNILFGRISEIKKALKVLPLPGRLVNIKNKITYRNDKGDLQEGFGGRLETTMQNIADAMELETKIPLTKEEYHKLPTFLLYNERLKTISVTKKEWQEGSAYHDTPIGAFLDKLQNHYNLFLECGFDLPPFEEKIPPSVLLDYLPSLGPLYQIIRQKMSNGKIAKGSELNIQCAEIYIENLNLKGSLLIYAPEGRVFLKNIIVENRGADFHQPGEKFVKGSLERKEAVVIKIQGSGEFTAENLTLKGGHLYEIKSNQRVTLNADSSLSAQEIFKPSWHWSYQLKEDHTFALTLNRS